MTRLLLVRHGETVDNVNQIMQGQTQGHLTMAGVMQAEQLAKQLSSKQIDAFVSSDLKRSIDTCLILARPHGLPVRQTSLLRERDWGGFTGLYIPDLKGKPWPKDVEPLEALLARATKFLQFISHEYPEKTVVAVGHGIINKAIQAEYRHLEMHEVPRMANMEMRELVLD